MPKKNNADDSRQLSMLDELDDAPFESALPAVSGPKIKYPALLAVVPLFAAGDREKYTTDQNTGLIYNLPRGRIRRIGAGLDMYDEDTLIAIFQLGAEKKVVGPRESMPVALPSASSPELNKTTVYKGRVTAGKINNFLDRGCGGADLERTRESIRRLANQRLWFENTDEVDGMEGVTDFFRYTGSRDLRGELLIQISPEMVSILQSYSVIDMTVRKRLNDCGKAVQRFLAPQVRESNVSLENLAEAIRYDPGASALKRSLLGRKPTGKTKGRPNQLDLMVELGFLEKAKITGTGRKEPFVLHWVKAAPSVEQLEAYHAPQLESV